MTKAQGSASVAPCIPESITKNGPHQANLVLITYASSEGSGEPAHHSSSESRGTFRQKARSLAPLNGWACAVKICHDGMLEDTNSLDGAQITYNSRFCCALCSMAPYRNPAFPSTVKVQKIGTPKTFAVITLKFEQGG